MNKLLEQRTICCPCGQDDYKKAFVYDAPPAGETKFPFSSSQYHREIFQCQYCGHFISLHDMDDSYLYTSDYVTGTYGTKGIQVTFDRINQLAPEQSDNIGRVKRVIAFAQERGRHPSSVLDVGSGLCVFLFRMKMEGWDCTALDLDDRLIEHARQTVQIKAIKEDFLNNTSLERYNAITFNKVLEHVKDPLPMLRKAKEHLKEGGFVYIELPDGESAARVGKEREEFFIEHHHIFSQMSLEILAQKGGYRVHNIKRIQEPSSKYTIYAFLTAVSS